MNRIIPAAVIAALLAGCASTSDLQATQRQIEQVNAQAKDRLDKIETKLSNDKLLDLVNQIDTLKATVAKLSGELEVLSYNQQAAEKRQNELFNDLDTRLGRLEGRGTAASAPSAASAPAAAASGATSPVAPAEPVTAKTQTVQDFDKALDLLRNRDFPHAITALQNYLAANPSGDQASDAQYWLGVAHQALRQYDAAIEVLRRFAEKYPSHPKAPDALRNIANCQRDMGQKDMAKATMQKLIKLYPKSTAAQRAKMEIKHL
jgi:tol-pal system protein YbgF